MGAHSNAAMGLSDAVPSAVHDGAADPSPWLDRVGIAASLACAVHCLAAPFLLLMLPAAGSIWSHPSVHWVLAALVLPLALVVVYRGYRRHRRRFVLAAAVLGAAFIVAGLGLPAGAASDQPAPAAALAGLDMFSSDLGPVVCTESCCPTIERDPHTGAFSLSVPPGSAATLAGSVLLVLAHMINLHGCYCFSRARNAAAGTCGCPTTCDAD